MKIILRIIVILLVAAVVAGGFSLAVNNSSSTSSSEGDQPSAMTDASGQTLQPMDRPDGGEKDGASLAGGLSGVLVTIAKIAGITALVTLIQKAFDTFKRRKLSLAQ